MEEKINPTMDKYVQAVKAITEQQSKIVGEVVAFGLAMDVEGLSVEDDQKFSITGDPVEVLKNLVDKYSILFGQISIDVSKDAVDDLHLFKPNELPSNLR